MSVVSNGVLNEMRCLLKQQMAGNKVYPQHTFLFILFYTTMPVIYYRESNIHDSNVFEYVGNELKLQLP